MRKLLSAGFSIFFCLAAILELVAQLHATDQGVMTFHRVGFFGWLILANLEVCRDPKST